MLTSIWSRLSTFSNEFLETRQDQDFKNKDLENGKETRHSKLRSWIPRGNRNKNILLYSDLTFSSESFATCCSPVAKPFFQNAGSNCYSSSRSSNYVLKPASFYNIDFDNINLCFFNINNLFSTFIAYAL